MRQIVPLQQSNAVVASWLRRLATLGSPRDARGPSTLLATL